MNQEHFPADREIEIADEISRDERMAREDEAHEMEIRPAFLLEMQKRFPWDETTDLEFNQEPAKDAVVIERKQGGVVRVKRTLDGDLRGYENQAIISTIERAAKTLPPGYELINRNGHGEFVLVLPKDIATQEQARGQLQAAGFEIPAKAEYWSKDDDSSDNPEYFYWHEEVVEPKPFSLSSDESRDEGFES